MIDCSMSHQFSMFFFISFYFYFCSFPLCFYFLSFFIIICYLFLLLSFFLLFYLFITIPTDIKLLSFFSPFFSKELYFIQEEMDFVRFCKGINNGCENHHIYLGFNQQFFTGSNYCKAAFHAGIINENGGFFVVKEIGIV